ncbi:uncharacterized protein LOC112177904 [Rosa chinensis]|uniref:uncharacterized protein LOC112177904 n=1 Tax=Rosa chinensis TaxID=74649 RepID=UPI000D08EED1|nr:uncharacterized protein LOC112177904 [Rosa chinensis]
MVRGAGSEKFRSDIIDLVKLHTIDILALCEPRVQFSKAKDTLLSLGFTDYKIVEANAKISQPNGTAWTLTALYASPTNSVRSNLWKYLERLAFTHHLPWIFMGDFNELYSCVDKNFGTISGRIGGLKHWVDSNFLIDMGALATLGQTTELKRDWIELSVLAIGELIFLRLSSDIFLKLNQITVQSCYNYILIIIGDFVKKTTDLSHDLQQWNINIFGNIFKRKNHLLARIGGIQKATDRYLIPWLFPHIDDVDMSNLCLPVDMNEVKKAMFSIGGLKAPGYDGFLALFYQKFWSVYSADVFSTVQNAFNSSIIPAGLNHTIISLIPKVTGPQNMVQFRPISLCTTIYKVISKIIVARIRPLMQKLISPNQVDLSKAYDRLSWKFIESVLYETLLPEPLSKLIMSCISSTSFQICFNGELTDSFHAQRGIRQGDPLSPYIFVLCMEKLSHLIQSTVNVGVWKAVRASQSGPQISHLFFADDLMLFSEATVERACILKKCLDIFCSLSGQAVSYEKSLIFCSPNTNKDIATDISSICGSPLTSDLGKYLGMPLIHSRVNKFTYVSILDKVQSRLSAWKCKNLSLVGRLTLIQSVTVAIPNYAMQTARFPMSICDDLDKINRNFLWDDLESKKKVNWDIVCLPKSLGGLGVKKATDMNQAMLAKAGWRIFQNDPGLWASIYREKYFKNDDLFDKDYHYPKDCSSTWKSDSHGADLVKRGLIWRVGDDKKIKFWIDIWLPPLPLIHYALPGAFIDSNITLCSFWDANGWNIDLLFSLLPSGIVNQIVHIPPGFDGCGDDIQIWGCTSNGSFSVKSAYGIFFNDYTENNSPWKFIWSLPIPPKLKTFLWVLCHGKLPTNVQRARRHLTHDDSCPICHIASESLSHLFKDCPAVYCIWNSFSLPESVWNTFNMDWEGWLNAHLHCTTKISAGVQWCSVFVFICWYIWKWRNKNSLSGKIGAGGVIRSSSADWIKGFQVNLGICEVLDAETWGLYYGLRQALACHITKIEVESDSAILVKLILDSDVSIQPLGSLIDCCNALIKKFQSFSLKHIYRECNMVADCLAKNRAGPVSSEAQGEKKFEAPKPTYTYSKKTG